MSQIPAAMDELLWMIAENGDDSAIETFLKRYPDQRIEILRRRRMVMDLRSAKPLALPGGKRPDFIPTVPRAVAAPAWRWPVVAASLVVLLTVTWAAYTVTQRWQARQAVAMVNSMDNPLPRRSIFRTAEPPSPTPAPVADPSQRLTPEAAPVVRQPAITPVPSVSAEQVLPSQAPYERPITVRLTETTLDRALGFIGRASGLSVVIGPGIPDEITEVDYVNVRPLEALKDMGRRYGFTVFDQGNGTVLVIPAVDPQAATAGPPSRPSPTVPSPAQQTPNQGLQGPIRSQE